MGGMTPSVSPDLRNFVLVFRDGHTETVAARSGTAAQMSLPNWSDVVSVGPAR